MTRIGMSQTSGIYCVGAWPLYPYFHIFIILLIIACSDLQLGFRGGEGYVFMLRFLNHGFLNGLRDDTDWYVSNERPILRGCVVSLSLFSYFYYFINHCL